MNGSSINHGLMKNIHTIATTHCIITQIGAVLIYFEVEARNHHEYPQFLDQRKQAKMLWLQDSNHSNVDNQNHAKREACRHYRNKRRNV
jgi:hypothetical protein